MEEGILDKASLAYSSRRDEGYVSSISQVGEQHLALKLSVAEILRTFITLIDERIH